MSIMPGLELLSLSRSPQTAKTVESLVRKAVVLQKKRGADVPQEVAVVALGQQRQALSQLKSMAYQHPVGAIGYITALCATDYQPDKIFDYRFCDDMHPDKPLLEKFFEPHNLFTMFGKYNVLDKVDSVSIFALDFPDISNKSFQTALYDSLHREQETKCSFANTLAQHLHREYKQQDADDEIGKRAKMRIEKTIEELSAKGYPSVQILAATLCAQQGDTDKAQEYYTAVLRNKYSSPAYTKAAKDALHLSDNSHINPTLFNAINRSHQSIHH